MSKIIELQFLNTLRLNAVNLEPNGKTVTLGGRNGQGKTSLLQTIAMVLGGADATPPKPLHRGKDKGHAIIKTDDGLTIKLTVTKDGRGTLTVTTKNNAKYGSPQDVLKKLTGNGAFDPLEFSNMKADAQRAALMKLLKLDFTAVDAKRTTHYKERTAVNRQVAQVEFSSAALAHYPDAPAEPVSTADLVAELERANQHNAGRGALEEARDKAAGDYNDALDARTNCASRIDDLEKQLQAERELLAVHDAKLPDLRLAESNAETAYKTFAVTDTAPISAKLSGAGETNRQVQANLIRQDALTALAGHRQKSVDLTAKIEAIDAEKADTLAKAPFPVAGLGFDESGVTYNGNPLEQANFDERLRVSMAMSAALNPSLRVVIIRDASLLDPTNLQHLMKLLEEYDMQGFVERVGDGKECTVIIEDGAVAEVRDAAVTKEAVLSHDAHEGAQPAPTPTAFSLT